jgi:hypothetical protein
MRLKSELYKKEQSDIIKKIFDILDLDKDNGMVLYEFDRDKDKQKKILDLIPEIRKYFSFTSIIGAYKPEKAKRPCMSIIKNITKTEYKMMSCDYRFKIKEKEIRTKKYLFLKK